MAHLRSPALLVAILALAGCVQPQVVQYTSFQEREYPRRAELAQVQQKSTAELIEGGYLLIGYIDLRRNVRTCYVDGACTNHSDALPSTDDLRREAAQRGGDVVTLLEERTVIEKNDKSVCTNWSTTTIMVKGKPQTTTQCTAHRSIAGKLEAKLSRALIWRHDPAAAAGEVNARAIEAALQTLETVQRAEQAKALKAGSSFLDILTGRETERRASSALDEEIYRAIADNDRHTLERLARERKLAGWKDEKGRSALMVALVVERMAAARVLLALGGHAEQRDEKGLSALHYAAARADLPLLREVAASGYDLRAKTSEGSSLLFFAIYNPRPEVFEWLLAQGLDPTERTNGEILLMRAADSAPSAVVLRLLDLGAAIDQRDRDGRTALLYAARAGRAETVDLLLRRRADVKATDAQGGTALHYAAAGGNAAVIRLLLDRGVAIDAPDMDGETALLVALRSGRWQAANQLIDRGASLTTKKFSAERVAAFLISKNEAQLLQRYTAAFPALTELLRRDPNWLQYAAKTSGRATIRYLVELGARVNHPGTDGVTPLWTAASTGNHDTVRALLELKADPTVRDRRGYTVLRNATLQGHAQVVEALRDFNVKE